MKVANKKKVLLTMAFVLGFILDTVAGNYVTIENTNSNPRENPVVELSLAKMGINTENAYWYVKDEKGNLITGISIK